MSYNWKPVVGSLLKTLQDHNFELVSMDNGDGKVFCQGTPRQQRQQAKTEICATDESHLFVKHPSHGEHLLWIFVVLGNAPEETVCDYTVFDILDLALDQFSKKWENKPCPQY